MNYFLDTEFIETGHQNPITLISIGLVSEDGREFYAENSDVDLNRAVEQNPWLKDNVVAHLERTKLNSPMAVRPSFGLSDHLIAPHKEIGQSVLRFLGMDQKPKFWAYFADYDWVVFCQLFGSMVTLPPTFPHYCRDLKQEMSRLGVSKPTLSVEGRPHHALTDARWGKGLFEYMKTKGMLEF